MPPSTNPAGWPKSDTLLLDPTAPYAYNGSVFKISKLSQQASGSLNLPFLSFDQNALAHIVLTVVNEPHRGRGKWRYQRMQGINKVTVLKNLSNEHHITKAWLQYFRAIILRLPIAVISSQLTIAQSQWRRWESPSPHLPPPQWMHLLWRWWERNRDWRLSERYDESKIIPWTEIATENDRANLRKLWRPGFYDQSKLHDPIKDQPVVKQQKRRSRSG